MATVLGLCIVRSANISIFVKMSYVGIEVTIDPVSIPKAASFSYRKIGALDNDTKYMSRVVL